MKKCSYCGAEYSDKFAACPVDQTPFDVGRVEASPVIERKLPFSLLVLSYLFFIPGVMAFFYFVEIIAAILFMRRPLDGSIIGWLVTELVFGSFFIALSRGLRRCSRFWRTCAFVVISVCFISWIYGFVTEYLNFHNRHQMMPAMFLFGYGCTLVLALWPFLVLMRRDVRQLFYDEL